MFYNKTKGGTDSFDKKCHDYSVSRKTARWPMRMFYGMLDQANVNCFILYNLNSDNPGLKRRDFIQELSLALLKPFLQSRLTIPTLRFSIRLQIENFLKDEEDTSEDQDSQDLLVKNKFDKRKRCSYCPYNLDRKTFEFCLLCRRAMCRDHVAKICAECLIKK